MKKVVFDERTWNDVQEAITDMRKELDRVSSIFSYDVALDRSRKAYYRLFDTLKRHQVESEGTE